MLDAYIVVKIRKIGGCDMKTNKKIYKDNQYTLSIDPGLNNVGWALFDEENKKMVEMGVRKFEPAKEAKTARLK